jgi:hypothetical protein
LAPVKRPRCGSSGVKKNGTSKNGKHRFCAAMKSAGRRCLLALYIQRIRSKYLPAHIFFDSQRTRNAGNGQNARDSQRHRCRCAGECRSIVTACQLQLPQQPSGTVLRLGLCRLMKPKRTKRGILPGTNPVGTSFGGQQAIIPASLWHFISVRGNMKTWTGFWCYLRRLI